jgi:hypothetical protein
MISFANVEATEDREFLKPGGYVMTITKATDNPACEYVEIEFDVAEGDFQNWLKDSPSWAKSTRKYYKGKAAGMFKRFYLDLDVDNPTKKVKETIETTGSVIPFVGCKFGALMQNRLYTKNNGDDGTVLEVAKTVPCEKIRNNDYKLPEPRDMRDAPSLSGTAEAFSADVPF